MTLFSRFFFLACSLMFLSSCANDNKKTLTPSQSNSETLDFSSPTPADPYGITKSNQDQTNTSKLLSPIVPKTNF